MSRRSCVTTVSLLTAMLTGCGGGGDEPRLAQAQPMPAPPVAPAPPVVPVVPAPPPVAPEPAPVAPVPPPVVPVAPPVAFAVVSSLPADGEAAAPRSGKFVASVSVAPDPASISGNVQLLGPVGNAVPGAWSANGTELSFTPAAPALPGATTFTVNFGASLRDKDGQLLGAPATRSFTTAPQGWGAASQVAALPYFTSGATPAVTIDKSGNITAVWQHQVNRIVTAYASRMDRLTGAWSTPVVIHMADSMSGDIARLGVQADANGNVYAVWTNYASSGQAILMARFVAATSTWERAVPFNGLPAGMTAASAIFTVDGKGILTVVTRTDSPSTLYATRFDPAARTWGTPQEIEKPAADNYLFNEQVLADSLGNFTLGWVQRGSLHTGMNVARYSAATGKWSAPHTLDDNVTATPFALAANAAGGATLAWTHGMLINDIPYVAAARFDLASDTWRAPVHVSGSTDVYGAGRPAVALDAVGSATLVWAQGNNFYTARSDRLGATWSPAAHIGTAMPGIANFTLSADIAGNVMLLFSYQGEATAMRYGASDARWGAPVLIGKPTGATSAFANDLVGVVDASGDVSAVWLAQTYFGTEARNMVVVNRYR